MSIFPSSVSSWRSRVFGVLAMAAVPAATFADHAGVSLTPIGVYEVGLFNSDGGVAEIVAHDPDSQTLFVVSAQFNEVRVIDIGDPSAPVALGALSVAPFRPNSVATHCGVIAIACENEVRTSPGKVFFFDRDFQLLSSVTVGSVPDMVTFSPNGRWVLVANEGEPNSYGEPDSVDPEGSVSIIDMTRGPERLTQRHVRTAGFAQFSAAYLKSRGVRVFGPGATPAQDLEPEYITVSHDSKTAWVTLQENNALAILNIAAGTFTSVVGLGLKDHTLADNGLDPSDRDGGIHIGPWPVKGMYQADGIDAYRVGGQTFLVLANEGDAREWGQYSEVARIGSSVYALDPAVFPNFADLKQNAKLGRLQASLASGDANGDGKFEEIHVFGARSFSIRDAAGNLVWDSGDQIEQIEAIVYPNTFNASHSNNTLDGRSPNKGPEPENVVIGKVSGRDYAFVGLERIGGILTYDISNPYAPVFVDYANRRDFSVTPNQANLPQVGDLGPEGLIFIKAESSPTGVPLVVVGNEVSGTVTLFEVKKGQ